MKRTIAVVAGVITLGVGAYLGSRLWAQQGYSQPGAASTSQRLPPAQSRIAVLNMHTILINYNKHKNFMQEYKVKQKQLIEDRLKDIKPVYEARTKELSTCTDPSRREQLQKDIRHMDRQVQDVNEEANQILAKMEADHFVRVYKDIQEAVQAYAPRAGYEMVLHYTDGTTEQEKYAPRMIGSKLVQLGSVPIYCHPTLDITNIILDNLNQKCPAVSGGAPTGQQQPVQQTGYSRQPGQ